MNKQNSLSIDKEIEKNIYLTIVCLFRILCNVNRNNNIFWGRTASGPHASHISKRKTTEIGNPNMESENQIYSNEKKKLKFVYF